MYRKLMLRCQGEEEKQLSLAVPVSNTVDNPSSFLLKSVQLLQGGTTPTFRTGVPYLMNGQI